MNPITPSRDPTDSETQSGLDTMLNNESITIPLVDAVFPSHASSILETSYPLHIVTPPSHILSGFVSDPPFSSGHRIALVCLPPPHESSARPERLGANFSDVLRPHDSARLGSSSSFGVATRLHGALDIRESLTALLDLAGECLEATQLVLILDKQQRDDSDLKALLHNLLYAGGTVLQNRAIRGWSWDTSRWVLVGMEL